MPNVTVAGTSTGSVLVGLKTLIVVKKDRGQERESASVQPRTYSMYICICIVNQWDTDKKSFDKNDLKKIIASVLLHLS